MAKEFNIARVGGRCDACDAVLAPDSSMMHAAGTLGIPCVAFFGPFPYRLRTAYYDSVFALIALNAGVSSTTATICSPASAAR